MSRVDGVSRDPSMERLRFMNKIGFGFLRIPMKKGQFDQSAIQDLVDCYMENGGTYFDTCYTYLNGQSEAAIRECVVKRKPRHLFRLADKLPGYQCRSHEDCRKYFHRQLERCGVDWFDDYLLHWMNRDHYAIAEEYDEFRFLQEIKAEGKARRIGFSYHDDAALLDEILTRHPEIDLVLLQINYLDWDASGIESGKCYETCVKHGKTVMVMEPVKGGSLAKLPEEAETKLQQVHPDWTPSDWALRFAQSLPGTEIVLSGMNSLSQIQANLRSIDPLTEKEMELLMSIRSMIRGRTAIECTGCGYCVPHCPQGIAIPDFFALYNEMTGFPGDAWKVEPAWRNLMRRPGNPSACISCHRCEKHCPQHIPVAEKMKDLKIVY